MPYFRIPDTLVTEDFLFRNMILDQSDGSRFAVTTVVVAAGLSYVREPLQCGHCVA